MIKEELFSLYKKDDVKKNIIIEIGDDTLSNDDLHQDNFSLYESICSQDNLRWGGCEANYIKFRMNNSHTKLKGKTIKAYQILNNDSTLKMPLGTFKVESDTPASDKKYRDITAYDMLYTMRNKNMTTWYNHIVFPITIKKLRDSFFEQFEGVEQVDIELPNDNAYIYQSTYASNVYGSYVLSDICAINGCFGKINRDGLFDYIFITADKDKAIQVEANIRKDISYEDYVTHDINQIKLTQTDVDADFYYGDGDNSYPISLQVLQVGENKDTLTTLCSNIFDKIAHVTFSPIDLKIRGNPCLETGDFIVTSGYEGELIYSYILQRDLDIGGFEEMTDDLQSKGAEIYTRDTSDNSIVIYDNSKSINTLYKNNFYAYTFTNEEKFNTSSTKKMIIKFNLAATSQADVIFIATIPFTLDSDGYVRVDYYKDGAIIDRDSIRSYYHKGDNEITLTNYMTMDENGRLTLTVSINTEYVESIERQHTAKIISFENYIKTTKYENTAIDTTIPTLNIPKYGIKAICFARGLAGGTAWDGTINIAEQVPAFSLSGGIAVNTFKDILSVKTQIPTARGIVETVSPFTLSGGLVFAGAKDSISFDKVINNHLIDVSKANLYTYNKNYVLTDTKYELKTDYIYNGTEESIDSGRMSSVELDFTQFASVEEVTIFNV